MCWCSVTNVTQWSSTQTSVYILTQLSVTHSTRTLSSRITGNCLSLPQPTPTFLTVCTHNMCFSGFVDVFMCGFTVNDVVVVVWKSPWDKSRISWTAMFQMKVHQSAASLVLWLVQKFRPCDDRILCLTNNWDILTCKLTDTVMCLVYLYTFAWSDGVYWWLKELLDFKNPAFSICKGFFRMTSDLCVSHDVNCRHHGVISCLTKCWQTDMCMCVCSDVCIPADGLLWSMILNGTNSSVLSQSDVTDDVNNVTAHSSAASSLHVTHPSTASLPSSTSKCCLHPIVTS